MSEEQLTIVASGQKVLADHHNQLVTTVGEDFVPRNLTGTPTASIGDLGSSLFPWKNVQFTGNLIENGSVIDTGLAMRESNLILNGKQNIDRSPNFVEVVASSTSAKISAGGANPNLDLIINGNSVALTTDFTFTSLITAPASNNTASVNDVAYTDQNFTKTEGEHGDTFITIDGVGTEITNRDQEIHVFSHGAGPEYFLAFIDIPNNRLISFKRGIAGSEREEITNNDVITLLSGNYLFLEDTLVVPFTNTVFPVFQPTDPTSPGTGDIYFNTQSKRWKRFNGTIWENKNIHWLGYAILDSVETEATVSNDFDFNWSPENETDVQFVDSDTVRIITKKLSVSGIRHEAQENFGQTIQLSVDREAGVGETSDTLYYIYADNTLTFRFSDKAPRPTDKKRGFYHPSKYWRCIGFVFNNSSSNINFFTVKNRIYEYGDVLRFNTVIGTALTRFEFLDVPNFLSFAIGTLSIDSGAGGNTVEVFVQYLGSSSAFRFGFFSTPDAQNQVIFTINIPIQNSTMQFLRDVIPGATSAIQISGIHTGEL